MLRFFMIFIVLSVFMSLGVAFLNLDIARLNYWDYHGVFLLICLTFFPRLTLLFSSIPFGGVFWWLGFIFCPHYLVAILATIFYWHQNPVLVSIAWCVALGAESSEKYYIQKRVRTRRHNRFNGEDVIDVEAH